MRKKVLIVPYLRQLDKTGNDIVRLVIFRDTKTGEWTLLSGGCKMKEDYVECAIRETHEETYGSFHLDKFNKDCFSNFRFITDYRPEELRTKDKDRRILSEYFVLACEITHKEYEACKNEYMQLLEQQKYPGETQGVSLYDTRRGEKEGGAEKLWDFMEQECIGHVMRHIVSIASPLCPSYAQTPYYFPLMYYAFTYPMLHNMYHVYPATMYAPMNYYPYPVQIPAVWRRIGL